MLVALGVSWLRTSRLGSAMLAVRADERSAAAAGINVVRVKLIGFAIAAFIAGLGGSLLAYQLGNVTFQDFDAYLGLVTFSVVVVAGITSVSGGILAGIISSGGILVALISSGVGSGGVDNWYGVVAGIGVILTVIFNPDGIVGPTHLFLEQRRARGVLARPDGALVPSARPASETQVAEPTPTGWHRCPVVAPASWSGATPASGPTGTPGVRDRAARPLLEVQNLTVRYGGVVAVDDVSFSVARGPDRRIDRPQRRRQDDDDRRALRLPRLRGHRVARRAATSTAVRRTGGPPWGWPAPSSWPASPTTSRSRRTSRWASTRRTAHDADGPRPRSSRSSA